jgi:DNA (cytosine-5)-methyltransferase 1
MNLRFGSVCSGVEAASLAWEPLGWLASFVSEIEPFPAAVLKYHWPSVPNLGDMTKIDGKAWRGKIDVLVGGTPCQAFSVAGKRQGLDDARGNLTLTFVELADAIDPWCVVWENVPGVLSDKTNAFGCLLAGLAGADAPLVPPGKWSRAGVVAGPERTIAWRVLDAQYFGVAQRRRRVFVVAFRTRDGIDPAEVLLESKGVRRDSPPSRSSGQGITCSPEGISGNVSSKWAKGTGGPAGDEHYNLIQDLAPTLDANYGKLQGCSGQDANHGHGHLLPMITGTLEAHHGNIKAEHAWTGKLLAEPLPFDTTQATHPANRSNPRPGDPCHPLAAEGHPPAIAFNWQNGGGYGEANDGLGITVDGTGPLSTSQTPAVTVEAFKISCDCGHTFVGSLNVKCPGCGEIRGGVTNEVVYSTKLHNTKSNQAGKFYEEYTAGLDRNSPPPAVVAPALTASNDPSRSPQSSEVTQQVAAVHAASMAVRRLTPVECERLQGMPDNHTRIPWGKKPAVDCPDGPRYRAIGNSMAVPVMNWIGRQVDKVAATHYQPMIIEKVA